MGAIKLFTFTLQSVHTPFKVDVKMRIVVNGQIVLHRKEFLLVIDNVTPFHRHGPESREVHSLIRNHVGVVKCAINAISCAKTMQR